VAFFVLLAAASLPAHAAWGPGSMSISDFPPAADATPSFSCKKAKTVDEIVICSNASLAALDRRLGHLYVTAKSALPKPEKEALIEAQRKWMDGRTPECADFKSMVAPWPDQVIGCYSQQYRTRITALQALLTQGRVIREIAGSEPWAEDTYGSEMIMNFCFEASGADLGMYNLPVPEQANPRYTLFLIDGIEYVFFNASYSAAMRIPRGAYVDGEEPPESVVDSFSCTVVFSEPEPGAGFSVPLQLSPVHYGWEGIHSFADVLKGYAADNKPQNDFAVHVHNKLQSDDITLKEKKGATRHFRWDSRTQWYLESR
jgi:uncharacterized protein YecT (DUF1311 family)